MNTDFNNQKISEVLAEKGENVTIIDHSDHHIYFDNPEDLLVSLLQDLQSIHQIQEVEDQNMIRIQIVA